MPYRDIANLTNNRGHWGGVVLQLPLVPILNGIRVWQEVEG